MGKPFGFLSLYARLRVGTLLTIFSLVGGGVAVFISHYFHLSGLLAHILILIGCVAGMLVSFELVLAARLRKLARFMVNVEKGNRLIRVPSSGGTDLVSLITEGINRVLVQVTSLEAKRIDTMRELRSTQSELQLKEELAAKSEKLARKVRERTTLFQILRAAASPADVNETLDRIAEIVSKDLDWKYVAILATSGPEKQTYVVRGLFGFPLVDRAFLRAREVDLQTGVAGVVAQTGRAIYVPDVSHEPEYLAFWDRAPRHGSYYCVPLKDRDGNITGVLAAARESIGDLQPDTADFFDVVASQISTAIEHSLIFERMKQLSLRDGLTGLPNRRNFDERLQEERFRAIRFGEAFSLIFVDVDHFKRINDQYGHIVGDRVLEKISKVLLQSTRQVDSVTRFGGEEFAILLPRTSLSEALSVARKLRQSIATTRFLLDEDVQSITVSAGVSQWKAGMTGEELLEAADNALYHSKDNGRDCISYFWENEISVDSESATTPSTS